MSGRWRSPLLLFAAIFLLRAPGFLYGVVDIDETDWITITQAMRRGAVLYVDIAEKKPPVSWWFYLTFSPFGFNIWPVQLAAIGWVYATALVAGRTARLWTGREEAGVAAAWIYAALSVCNTFAVMAELMLNLPVACALYAYVRADKEGPVPRRWELLAGIFAGVAATFKHQAGILLVALCAAALIDRKILRIFLLGIGFTIPWAGLVALYSVWGHLDAFFEWNIIRNVFYISLGAGSVLQRAAEGITLFVVLAAPIPWALAIRATFSGRARALLPHTARWAMLLALWLSWIPVSLGGRFYGHYFVQLALPLSIVAAPGVVELIEKARNFDVWKKRALIFTAVFPLVLFQAIGLGRWIAGDFPCQEKRTIEVARWLRENTKPEERVFLWGHYSPIFYLSERIPGTHYLNTSVHMGDFDPNHITPDIDLEKHHSERDVRLTLEDLEKNRVEIIVDSAPADIHQWSKIPLESFPELIRYVRASYTLVATPAGAHIYRRNGT